MFPLSDDNPRLRPPIALALIIIANALVWALLQGFGTQEALIKSLCLHALIPGDLLGNVEPGTRVALSQTMVCVLNGAGSPTTILTAMFMHGGWFHIIGNMWFLWVFGDNVEDVMGPVRFVVFYLLCGLAAAGVQIATDPASTVPMVGASGAIGGVMGAYALLFPKARVNTLIFLGFFITTVRVPALFMLGYWFVIQLLQGLPALGTAQGGVAFWAHIGGFLAGVILIRVFARSDWLAEHPIRLMSRPRRRRPPEEDDGRWF
jgi:membrane associated rhomboid family serine protease